MKYNINVNVEGSELILKNKAGDYVIIPKKYRLEVQDMIKEKCYGCIDKLVETLPVMEDYAQDGSVFPNNKIVKVNQNNEVKEYNTSSKEYRDLYNSGKLMNYDKNTDTYIATPLEEVTVTAEAPQWAKDKMQFEKEYTKDMFIDESMPKWSRSMGISATNMNPNNIAEYDKRINDKVVENIFKRKPTFDTDYSNDRLKTLQGFTQKELELIKNSKYASKIEPSIWSKFEQGLLSVGNAGSPVTFKNENLTQEEAKKEDNPLNILQPLNIPSKMVQSAYKKDYSLKDALKGKQNNAGIVEDIVTDPLNLVGIGLAGKLSKADKVIDATKVGGKVLSKADDAVNNINRIKFDDFKNDNEFFRVIVGDEAFDDIVQTQKIRTKKPSSVENTPSNVINLDRRGSTAFPSFSKGSPSLSYANDNPNHYIIRTADESIKPSTSGRHGKGTTMFPTDKSGKHLTELDASKVQVYKHVGNGEYELVNTAKPVTVTGATKVGSKVLNKTDDVVKPIVSFVDDVGKQASKQWQLEELPGLHLKSTMEGQAISKIIEPKTGLINVEQALGIIRKESGGANKVSLIRQGLGENIPKKMDYNEFRKVVQDQLIPLEKKVFSGIDPHYEEPYGAYGLENIGIDVNSPNIKTHKLTLSNKSKFGRGSSAHGNPEETLGHFHITEDADIPNTIIATELQADPFQGTHRIMPKTQQEALEKVNKLKEEGIVLKSTFEDGKESSNAVLANYEKHLQLDEASAKNFTQKQLLDKNHQERYLQELVDYAGKRGDINKIRVPTSETAAKVQGYRKEVNPLYPEAKTKILNLEVEIKKLDNFFKDNFNHPKYKEKANKLASELEAAKKQEINSKEGYYSSKHQTILKKYSEQPKTIKKLFGEEPKIVTDSKGNTWYEFDIPKKFKEGKGEIKAFQVIPPSIGSALYLQSQNKNKTEH